MLLEQINKEELEFMELFYNPVALVESLFHNFDSLGLWDSEEKLGHYRLFQLSLLSYEYLIDTEVPSLSPKENFKLKEGAGSLYCFGGRKFGKSLCVEKLDLLTDMLLSDGNDVGFSSIDMIHIRGILEPIIQCLENHPIFQLFEPRINRSPSYNIYLKNGHKTESINMNLASPDAGKAFFQKHVKKLYGEEFSFETDKVYEKRIESISELGCVNRISGMTGFTKYSPAGRIFYDLYNNPRISNLPQFISPIWDEQQKARAIKEHGGEQSIAYRIYVKGEVVEDGISVFDMNRIRPFYNSDKVIKNFEITKDNFIGFENFLVLECPTNASNTFVAADIGETAASEIIVLFEINNKYRYTYNITLYGLTDKEQDKIFEYIIKKVKANYIAIDTSEGTGRSIFRYLADIVSAERLTWVSFNEKIVVGFQKQDDGSFLYENGKLVEQEEYISEWSIRRLKDLFYEGRIDLPLDYKLDLQLNSVIATQSGNRIVYDCTSSEDHLLAAFRVFSICQWSNEFNSIKPFEQKQFCKGII